MGAIRTGRRRALCVVLLLAIAGCDFDGDRSQTPGGAQPSARDDTAPSDRAAAPRCSDNGFIALQAAVDVPNEVSGTGYTVVAGPPEGPLMRLTREHMAAAPAIRPDGQQIAFDTARNYGWSSDSGPSGTDVYVMDSDGSHQRKIAEGWGPVWSPDGTKLLFVRDGLWFHDLGTGEDEQIVRDPARGPAFIQIEDVEWLRDGRISWVQVRETQRGVSTVLVADFPPTSERKLVERTGYIRSFDWSPVRNEFVYTTSHGWLFLVRPGTEPELLHKDAGDAVWSPDGDRVRFVILRHDDDGRLVEMELPSRKVRPVELAGRFEGWSMQKADWISCDAGREQGAR